MVHHFQTRWAGTLANTRAFGDIAYKPLGIFAEPSIVSRVIDNYDISTPAASDGTEDRNGNGDKEQVAFVVLFSDGISEMMSDQEVVDIVRLEKTPDKAATRVVEVADAIGA